ncbi:hypothetical protein BSKO_07760 [Bryopsis sp. KO-2023]|nr:hypothetical protein BSKO_07760 [Bryopsis sp. KO-2023]
MINLSKKVLKPFLKKLADVECDIPVPTAKGVLRKISDEETLEAQEDVIKLLKLGTQDRKVLKEIQKVSTKECKVVSLAAILANAMDLLGIPEQGWEDVFISLFEAIDECEGPPPEVEEPPQEGTLTLVAQPPRAADLVAMLEDGDIDGALATVVELVENGDDVEAELEGAVSLAMEKNLGRDLGFVLITVAGDHPELEDILNPFLEELLERMSVADVANEL